MNNPFPGLRPFRSDEHHLFFGREEQTAALLQLLRTKRFLAVVGTSGSGKSSLVRAGMIAALHGGTLTQAGSTWEVMILRPGGSPIDNLARAFLGADLYDPEDPSTLPRLLATLSRSRFGLVEARKQCALFEPGTNLLVVVDQFEELFRFRQQGVDSEETAAAFVNLLLTAGEQEECPIYVAITMRSDYLGDCSEIPGLAEAVNEGEYLIPRLLRDQKRDAIEKPIGVGGARIAPLLVQRLLNDVGDDPDQLPVLQHALMRMWDAWSKGSDHGRPIDFGDFEATGGLAAALSNHADEIYDALPDDRHRSACEKIFKTLTEKGSDNRGIRRPTRLARLEAIAAADRDTVTAVLDAYRGAGVTFVMPGMEVRLDDRTVLDLSHESLMRGWQRLRLWVEDEAQSARIFRRLVDTARLWNDGKASLFRDPDLQIALSWRAEEAPNADWAEQYGGDFATAIGFLERSEAEADAERHAREAARLRELEQARQLAEAQQLRLEQQQRAARRLRTMIAGLAAVLALAVLACAAALVANQRAITLAGIARQNEAKAEQNAQRAEESQQETARALAVVASQKAAVEGSLSKAEAAERSARAAEEAGRKLWYTTDMQLVPFIWNDPQATSAQLRIRLSAHVPEERMKDEGGRMNKAGDEPGSSGPSSFRLHPSSFDLRGFEWYYYQHLLDDGAAVFSAHQAPVLDAVFTPDGPLVTLDQKGRVRRWDLDSRAEDEASRRDQTGRASARLGVLSPDGRLAALGLGNKVQVLDTTTGKETFSIGSMGNSYQSVFFAWNAGELVIVDNKIRWCDASSGAVIASVDLKFDHAHGLALSADGRTLAVIGHGRNSTGLLLLIFRLDPTAKTATPLAKDLSVGGAPDLMALSPDGRRIVASSSYSSAPLQVFDTTTGHLIAEQPAAHSSPLGAVAFSGDAAMLATADAQGTIKIWTDVEHLNSKSAALLTLKGHQGAINSVHFSIDGKRLVTASADRTARVWDLENSGASIRPLERWGSSTAPRFSADGQLIATSGSNGVGLWDAATGRLVRQLPVRHRARSYSYYSVAFSPTDSRLLAVVDETDLALWDLDGGTELARLTGAAAPPDSRRGVASEPVTATAFSPDGKYLAAAFYSRSPSGLPMSSFLKVWEVATRQPIHRLTAHTSFCNSVGFTRDGALLASGSYDGTAIIWSTATWKKTQTLRNPDDVGRRSVSDVAFSPDGKILAMATYGGNLHLFDVATGKLGETLKGHAAAVQAVEFSPDGRTLASGSDDRTVRLWNVPTRRELMQLDPGSVELGPVYALAFSPDGTQLLTAGRGAAAFWSTGSIVWNDPDRAAEKLRHLLQSNADFRSRIRMFSENLRLPEALEKLDARDVRVQAALAATQANGQAARQARREAALAFDRLAAADPTAPEGWLRTPGLLRVATALLHQDRPAAAALLLQGGARRRIEDGLPAVEQSGPGFAYSVTRGTVRVTELLPDYPGSRAGLLVGDTIAKVNDTELTTESLPKLGDLLAGDAGTKVRLTVRHSGSEKPEVIELTRERFLHDPATGVLLHPLREAVNDRLAQEPRNPALLELRAELAGQWSDAKAQAADFTAALEALSHQEPEASASDLRRLYRRRGEAYVALKQWQEAVDDYARGITAATADDALLANQALAQANATLEREPVAGSTTKQTAARLAAMKLTDPWQKLAATYRLEGDQQAIDRLIERRPKLAGPIGDLFTQDADEDKDWRRAIALYSRGIAADAADLELLAKRARAHEALHDWDAAAADWSRAANGTPEGAPWLAEFARRLAAAGRVPLAKGPFEKAQALYERALEADPDDEATASGLAQLLLDKDKYENPARRVVLTPVEMKSETGARLELQEDGSIFVHQKKPFQNDAYSLVFPTEGKGITSLRLEVLADSRLPVGGPGWGTDGNFWLNEVTLEAAPAGSPDRAKAIPLRTAWADFSQVDSGGPGIAGAVDGDVRGAVDGKAGTGWAIFPKLHQDHTAVFELAEEIGGGQTSRLAVRLIHQQFKKNQKLGNLGRFRLSVSGSPAALDWERKHAAATNLADPWHKLAAAYHVIGNQPALDELLRHHPAAESGIAQLYVAAGRTREAVPLLAKASAANPQDTMLSQKVAALQAWYGMNAELAVTCRRALAYARDSTDPSTAERTAKSCSLRPTDDAAQRAAALDLARSAVKLGMDHPYWPYYQMALGMAEYRSGNDAAAQEALRTAASAAPGNLLIVGTSAFYRAMSLFRQGQEAEARRLATDAVSRLKPLPADEQNPLAGGRSADDLILWMAFKEARAVLQLEAAPARARRRPPGNDVASGIGTVSGLMPTGLEGKPLGE